MAHTDITADCCGDTQPTNPKADVFRRSKRGRNLQLFQIQNPIPDEVRDPDTLTKMFQKWNFVPYAGTSKRSGQMLLVWYLMLAKLSPTNSACIGKKVKYALGGKATFERAEDAEWDTGEASDPMTPAEKTTQRDAVNQFVTFENGVSDFHRRIGWAYEATGNAWVEMTYAETMGEGRVNLKAHPVTHCLYVNTKPGEMKIIAVSPVWEDAYLDKKPPRFVPKYPAFMTMEDGSLKTMFHLKNGENEWYGRPASQGADLYKYREVQDALYLVKQAGANFTGQLIIEVEDDDPQTAAAVEDEKAQDVGFSSFAERFEQNYTNKSDDPQSVLITARPYGSRPMFVFQVAPNTNQEWYKVTGEIAENKIMQAHNCTPRFMGKEVAGGFSQDVFISDYIINMEPVIDELRNRITNFTNGQLSVAWLDLLNKPELNAASITFMPPIKSQIEQYKTQQSAVAPIAPVAQLV